MQALPANDDSFGTLEDFLHGDNAPQDAMTIPVLDGLLAAVAIGPELIPPSEWMEQVWGDTPPVFATKDQGAAVLSALMEHYNGIIREVGNDPPLYLPMFWTTEEGRLDARDWCDGFMVGLSMRLDAWEPLLRARRQSDNLLPILAHCEDEQGNPRIDMADEDRALIRENAQALIAASVIAIDRFWKRKRKHPPEGTVSVSSFEMRVKIGRNDPCPCGSGKKFKKCCLDVVGDA